MLAILAGAGAVRAAEVVVLVSADLPPYLQAAEGVKGALLPVLEEEEVLVLSLAGKQERWPAVAERIERESPAVVVPLGSLATVLAARRLEGPAQVYGMILNPAKLLAGAAEPSRITGVSMDVAPEDIFGHIRQALPAARKVGVLYDPKRSQQVVDEARLAAVASGLDLVAVPVEGQRDLPAAVRDLCDKDVDLLWLFVDRTVLQTREGLEAIMLETLRRGIPVVAPSERYVKAGALLGMSVDYRDLGLQTGEVAREVLEGQTPLPAAQRPRSLVLSVNQKVREALQVDLPKQFEKEVSRFIE
jgi:ABC-type uncharacterized transport system substrate-binding protein